MFSPISVELFIISLCLALPALKSMEAVVDVVCSMPMRMHGCLHSQDTISGNELLKTGLWAHDISNSLNFIAKTNSGVCIGLC